MSQNVSNNAHLLHWVVKLTSKDYMEQFAGLTSENKVMISENFNWTTITETIWQNKWTNIYIFIIYVTNIFYNFSRTERSNGFTRSTYSIHWQQKTHMTPLSIITCSINLVTHKTILFDVQNNKNIIWGPPAKPISCSCYTHNYPTAWLLWQPGHQPSQYHATVIHYNTYTASASYWYI